MTRELYRLPDLIMFHLLGWLLLTVCSRGRIMRRQASMSGQIGLHAVRTTLFRGSHTVF